MHQHSLKIKANLNTFCHCSPAHISLPLLVWLLGNGYVRRLAYLCQPVHLKYVWLCCTSRDWVSANHEARFSLDVRRQ